MINLYVLYIIAGVGFIYLVFQVIFLWLASSPDSSISLVEIFLRVCSSQTLPIILLDPVGNGVNPAYTNLLGRCDARFGTLLRFWSSDVAKDFRDEIGNHYGVQFISFQRGNLELNRQGCSLTLVMLREDCKYYVFNGTSPKSASPHCESQQEFACDGVLPVIETVKMFVDNGLTYLVPKNATVHQRAVQHARFIPCNTSIRDEFERVHGITDDVSNAREQGATLLLQSKEALDGLQIPFWLSSGTCLGWYRQCDFIPYTTDTDIGVFYDDIAAYLNHDFDYLVHVFNLNGLHLHHTLGLMNDSFQMTFVADTMKLDIFVFYENARGYWNGGTEARTGNKFLYQFHRFTLCWTRFLELLVKIPCETEAYLVANYGIDWFVPVRRWNWKLDPPNLSRNGRWSVSEMKEAVKFFV